MPDCLRFGPAPAPVRAARQPPAGGFKPLHGLWRDLAEALAAGPRDGMELRRALGWTVRRYNSTTYFMRLAGMIEGRWTVALTARGLERLRQAHPLDEAA